MAKVGDKVYWKVEKSRRGNLVVRGMETVYSHYTNKEIAELTERVDGQNVITGFVSKVNKDGSPAEFGLPVPG